jgi:hypothetical protein
MISMTAKGTPLSEYKWKNRVLLIFAPKQHDANVQRILCEIEEQRHGLDDRDLVTGIIAAQGDSSLDEKVMLSREAIATRRLYHITLHHFVVVLIGKDGCEKFRSYEQPDLDSMFALIDQMPMRQQEVLTRGAHQIVSLM